MRASSGVAINQDQALVELAKAAREILLEVASTYRATISYRQLAIEVQKRAGIRAGRTPGWMVAVLGMVCRVTHRLAEPALTSLAVNHTDGTVGQVFDEVFRVSGRPVPTSADEREAAAAASRLDCYRRYAPSVPENAEPTAVSAQAAGRTPAVKAPKASAVKKNKPVDGSKRRDPNDYHAPFVVCGSCFIQTPPGDECQNCGSPL